MIITFVGHATVPLGDRVKKIVKEQIRKRIVDVKSVTFYLGGYGDFDEICACACRELKQECGGMELVYVTPYLTLSEQAKIKEMQRCGLYDASIYPPLENVPPRFAIFKRNEWMVESADLIIAYVRHNYGGAYQTFKVARRKKKEIINICDFVEDNS